MQLVACQTCHIQYDVTGSTLPEVRCPCGTAVRTEAPRGKDTTIHRCASCGAPVDPAAEQCDYCRSVIVRDRRKLSLICPECYARNPDESQFCTSCGVKFDPCPWEGVATEVACPACSANMTSRAIVDLPAYECKRCGGLWVPDGHFDTLIQRAVEAQRKHSGDPFGIADPAGSRKRRAAFSSKVVYRPCPVCERNMARRNFGRRSGVIIDRCSQHGTWLDSDELEDIASFILRGGLDRSTSGARPDADPGRVEALLEVQKMLDNQAKDNERRESELRKSGVVRRGLSIVDLLTDLLMH